MNEWKLKYDMDSMQWNITEIHLFEPTIDYVYFDGAYLESSYIRCIKAIWFELLPSAFSDINIILHCPENTYLLNKLDIIWIVTQHCLEELI